MLSDGAKNSGSGGSTNELTALWSGETIPHDRSGASSDSVAVFDIAKYLRILLKYRFVMAGMVLAAGAIGIGLSMLMTPIYSSTVTVQIDREAARVLDADSEVLSSQATVQAEEFFQTQYGLLRSRSLSERVVDSLGLANSSAFLETMGIDYSGSSPDSNAERRRLVIRAVQSNLTVTPVRGSRHVALTFESPDPATAARVANAFSENFIQATIDRKFESTIYVRDFLEERIAQTKGKLEDAERQLVAYAQQQQIISVTDESASASGQQESLSSRNLATLNASLSAARAARIAAEQKWLSAQSSPLFSLNDVLQNGSIQVLGEERAKLRAEYEQKLRVFQPEYPEMVRLQSRIDEIDSEMNGIATSIRQSIHSQYQISLNEERALAQQVEGLKSEVLDLRDRSIQYNILQREVDTSRTLYDGLLQRYKEVGVTGGVTANNVSIVDRAVVPTKPSSPKLLVNLIISLMIGVVLGLVAVFILEALDESLGTPQGIEEKLGLPVLGIAPLLPKDQSPVEALADIRSAFAEAYYSLRTALQFSTPHGAPTSLLVTSSRPAEGKSTTALAIALNLARVGRRVLLADGDLRNPSLHRTLGLDNSKGLSNVLSGADDLSSFVISTKNKGLSFLPCGPLPPSPAELWGSDRLDWFIRAATSQFDHVVIDGPPILGFADAPLLSAAVEGTVFVVEARSTGRGQARGAVSRLLIGRGRLLGVVLTKFNAKEASYGGYDYAYDYTYGAERSERTDGKA